MSFATIMDTLEVIRGLARPGAYGVSHSTIEAQLLEDSELRLAVCALMFHLQTEEEQGRSRTISKNKSGFMSSHEVAGTRCGMRLVMGRDLSPSDEEWVHSHVHVYHRQTARRLREAYPELWFASPVGGSVAPKRSSSRSALDDEMKEFLAWKAARMGKVADGVAAASAAAVPAEEEVYTPPALDENGDIILPDLD